MIEVACRFQADVVLQVLGAHHNGETSIVRIKILESHGLDWNYNTSTTKFASVKGRGLQIFPVS